MLVDTHSDGEKSSFLALEGSPPADYLFSRRIACGEQWLFQFRTAETFHHCGCCGVDGGVGPDPMPFVEIFPDHLGVYSSHWQATLIPTGRAGRHEPRDRQPLASDGKAWLTFRAEEVAP